MDKEIIRRFVRWLDQASEEEIMEHRKLVLAARKLLSTPEAKAQVNFALRLMDQEVLARLEASLLKKQA